MWWHYTVRTLSGAIYFIRHHGDSGHTYVTRFADARNPVIGDQTPIVNRLARRVDAKVDGSMYIRFMDGEPLSTSLVQSTLSVMYRLDKPYVSVNNDRQIAIGV